MDHRPAVSPSGPGSDERAAGTPDSVARRRLLRGGAGIAPVVLTLASRPVAANTCTVASSFISVATFKSRNPSSSAQCATKTCESWRSECSNSLSAYKAYLDGTTVNTLYGNSSSPYGTWTLSTVLKYGSGIDTTTELGVLQHLISLSMNLKSLNITWPGDLTPTYISGVWQNFKTNGGNYVLKASGINWNASQLITWARMLMYTNP